MSIRIVPIGEIEQGVLDILREKLGRVFGQDIPLGRGIPIPDEAYNPQRDQYAAETILSTVAEQPRSEGLDRTLAVADIDLYVPDLNFVFGLAGSRIALFSLHRLRQSFYQLPEDRELFYRRALTEAVHELGHTYGLPHSPDPDCVMYFSNSIADTDRKGPEFCNRNRERLAQIGAIR